MTHLLQPLDKCIFKVFKTQYKEKFHEFVPNEAKKEKWNKLDVFQTATVIAKQVFTPEQIEKSFVDCGIEPFSPQSIIEKIQPKERKELSDEELRIILTPNVAFQQMEKKERKRTEISNKVVTVKNVEYLPR